jgi:hypothetical protein
MAAVADTPAAVADTGSDRAAALTSGMVGKSKKASPLLHHFVSRSDGAFYLCTNTLQTVL